MQIVKTFANRFVQAIRQDGRIPAVAAAALLVLTLGWAAPPAAGQTAGDGAIEGTVTDSTGSAVPGAAITITDNATGVQTVRTATGAGFFNIAPVQVGTYTVQIAAKGFSTLIQDNIVVDALETRTLNPILAVGAATQTVTVTGAPPVLDTADATIESTMENATYSNLPIQMNGAQRDPTAFGLLTPGAQAANNGGRLPIIGGTGSYLGQLYLDGMPAETVSQQGDNRLVSESLDLDAVDQFQLVTSTPPAEYMGAGAENFTMKSGGLQYHGQVSDFIRNTFFDSWGFTAPWATEKNLAGQTVQAPKPVEHQNELSASFGGVVPHTAHKLFFFAAYDKYHERKGAVYSLYTIPTALMTTGNFTELACSTVAGENCAGTGVTGTGSNNPPIIYDPTTTTCNGVTCTRQPFEYNGTYNVIPPGELSPIAQAMESFLPSYSSKNPFFTDYNSSAIYNNYLGGWPSGFDNHVTDWRVDYDWNAKNRISTIGAMGAVAYLNNFGTPFLPPPYIGGDLADIYPKNYIVEDAYTISPNLVNQLKYSFTRFFQNIHDATQGVKTWEAPTLGITNLPGGQAGEEFPGASFGTTTLFGSAEQTWTGNGNSVSTQLTTPNNYALTDNVQLLKGKNAFTMGLTFQWQEINNANPATFTGVLDLTFNAYSTANFSGTALNDAGSGFSYASFLMGAVGGSTSNDTSAPSLGLDYVSELAGRYKTISPYIRDSFRLTPKLTLDLGVRWDYLPPYHELRDRWTFLNPTMTNPLTGTPGVLQFAGNYGGAGVSCGCTTPVKTYWKNWGPRVGVAYSINQKTVIRAGFAQVFTQAGGVGGRGGAYNGTGQTGFNVSAIGPTENGNGATAGPAYWLNNGAAFGTLGIANTGLFGPGFTYPAAPTPSVVAQELNTGFYVNPATGKMVSASSVSFADPYLSSRAPELELYNFGVERAVTSSMTLAVNYVGNESHFIVNSGTTGANARGYWTNELNPTYLSLLGPVLDSTGSKPLLNAQATPANLAILAQYAPNAPMPAFYTAAGAINGSATIQQMLVHFPQYSGVSDTWGNVGNFAYDSLQIVLQQRTSHGLTFTVNYTYAKNIGDDGTFRSGYAIPASALSGASSSATAIKQDRIDRSWTAISIPQTVHVFGVYELPFGKGQIGGNSMLVRTLAGGWQISENYSYTAGYPMAVTWSGASGTNTPGQGQGMPDLNTASNDYSSHNARINGSYGKGPNGTNACNIGLGGCKALPYVDAGAFTSPINVSTAPNCTPGGRNEPSNCNPAYLIGSAPRTAPLGLRNPGTEDIDAALRRTFPLHFEDTAFVFEADCLNLWNKNTFGSPNASWSNGSTTFGTITSASGARDWQFAGHINF
jgi:hypothetical protein